MGHKTLHLNVDPDDIDSAESQASLERAAQILRSGGLVGFPTETVYGLGANALDEAAVAGIFAAKQRPAWDPLIVHICDQSMLHQVATEIPNRARQLMEAFWPGPLTLLLPKSSRVPPIVSAGRPRVGVRMPAHAVARELIWKAGLPIAAPSANTFGHVSPTSAAHVFADLDGRIDAVLDAGETQHGLESTVVDACESPVILYRPGIITLAQIAAVCGKARNFAESSSHGVVPEALPSPGVGLRHYAPRARLILIEGEGEAQQAAFTGAVRAARGRGERVGLMLPAEFFAPGSALEGSDPELVYRWGSWADEEQLAQRLFAGLRQLDAAGAGVIACPLPSAKGLGVAIQDRLRKGAR